MNMLLRCQALAVALEGMSMTIEPRCKKLVLAANVTSSFFLDANLEFDLSLGFSLASIFEHMDSAGFWASLGNHSDISDQEIEVRCSRRDLAACLRGVAMSGGIP